VARLLRQLGYSPKVNARRAEARGSPPERDAQFRHITEQREQFQAAGEPTISVDAKKKSWSATSRMPAGPGAERPRRCWCMTGRRMPSAKRSLTVFMI
jgi:hypothetical protein